jgi:hypothetical protein
MNLVFSQSDLQTIMIKVLFKNNKWFDKSILLKETKKYYSCNEEDFIICDFLYIWELLLINTNFIKTQQKDNYEYIKIFFNQNIQNLYSESDYINTELDTENLYSEPDNEINFNLNIASTIDHMCKNKTINYKSKVISTFFKKNFPMYKTIYELLISNRINIGDDNVKNFINLYSNYIETDEIIDLIIYNKKINHSPQIQTVKKNYLKTIMTTGFLGFASLLLYNNSAIIKYFNLFNLFKKFKFTN